MSKVFPLLKLILRLLMRFQLILLPSRTASVPRLTLQSPPRTWKRDVEVWCGSTRHRRSRRLLFFTAPSSRTWLTEWMGALIMLHLLQQGSQLSQSEYPSFIFHVLQYMCSCSDTSLTRIMCTRPSHPSKPNPHSTRTQTKSVIKPSFESCTRSPPIHALTCARPHMGTRHADSKRSASGARACPRAAGSLRRARRRDPSRGRGASAAPRAGTARAARARSRRA
jgi:hypothetical protein